MTRRRYSVSVSSTTHARIKAKCAETGFYRSAVVEDACAKELQAGERLLEARRMAARAPRRIKEST